LRLASAPARQESEFTTFLGFLFNIERDTREAIDFEAGEVSQASDFVPLQPQPQPLPAEASTLVAAGIDSTTADLFTTRVRSLLL
jgi:hypothetical protein